MRLSSQEAFGNQPPPVQLIAMGCPGSGKSYALKQFASAEGVKTFRTTFHPELSYGDFVGAYKPVPLYVSSGQRTFSADGEPRLGKWDGLVPTVKYEYRAGPFINAYVAARCNPDTDVVLLIEEINRANPAAVFGDILQLLDRDDTGKSEYGIDTLPDLKDYLKSNNVPDSGILSLPANLFLWGTMNRADESVNYIDSAFLRRWSLHYLSYNLPCAYDDEETSFGSRRMTWRDVRAAINKSLREIDGIEDDKFIGPYFMKRNELHDKGRVFSKLITYLWYDVLPMERETMFLKGTLSEHYTRWFDGEQIFKPDVL